MRGLKKARRIQVIALAMAALALSTALIGIGMSDGINFFRAPSQLAADPPGAGEVFRLGGLVEDGSLVRGQGETVTFAVTDAYGSYAESFADYAKLMKTSPRYEHVAKADTAGEFAQGLQKAGYATDPAYADKLTRVINTTLRLQRTQG